MGWKNILYFDETDSTNTEIKKAAEKDAPHGTLAVADYQSMGKGRRGRSWAAQASASDEPASAPGALRPCASMLTLVAASAVADGIREVCDPEAKITAERYRRQWKEGLRYPDRDEHRN